MDKAEARAVTEERIAPLRDLSHGDLAAKLLGKPLNEEIVGPSGTNYQVEILGVWDKDEGGDFHVMTSIDDFSWRSFAPFSGAAFIMRPDGTFVDE